MPYGYPLTVHSALPPKAAGSRPAAAPRAGVQPGSWRYPDCRRSRPVLLLAAAVSAGLHLGLLFGVAKPKPAPKPVVAVPMIAVTLPPPQLKELDEPETVSDGDAKPVDLALPVPMQADLPALARPEDFVQALDFSSLLEQPDLRDAKISVIPEHIRRGVAIREQIGTIFNLADLDRSPEPVVQPSPIFPFHLKREALTGTVRVEFIVDTEGRVLNAFAVSSTHSGFDEAAIAGVSRWKFRPGIKGGRKVNTRMQVPIEFRYTDPVE